MSKQGSLARIEKYERLGKLDFLALEKKFYEETYGKKEEPKEEKPKK